MKLRNRGLLLGKGPTHGRRRSRHREAPGHYRDRPPHARAWCQTCHDRPATAALIESPAEQAHGGPPAGSVGVRQKLLTGDLRGHPLRIGLRLDLCGAIGAESVIARFGVFDQPGRAPIGRWNHTIYFYHGTLPRMAADGKWTPPEFYAGPRCGQGNRRTASRLGGRYTGLSEHRLR